MMVKTLSDITPSNVDGLQKNNAALTAALAKPENVNQETQVRNRKRNTSLQELLVNMHYSDKLRKNTCKYALFC